MSVQLVLEKAISQDGVRERPLNSNCGPEVRAYLQTTGFGCGAPWCAAFLAWCVQEVERAENINIAWPKTASCDVILTFARRHNILFTQPERGDVFLVMASTNDAIHTGFVTDVNGNRFGTVEGNSNSNGSREGIGVVRNNRQNSSRFRFVRWGNLLPDPVQENLTYELFLNDRKIADMPVSAGVARVAATVWGDALGFDVGWDGEQRAVLLDGQPVPATAMLLEGRAYLPIRVLTDFSGLHLDLDAANRRVTVTRPRT